MRFSFELCRIEMDDKYMDEVYKRIEDGKKKQKAGKQNPYEVLLKSDQLNIARAEGACC